jgi:hypothetical protein
MNGGQDKDFVHPTKNQLWFSGEHVGIHQGM